ncbi:MAG: translocation/assembly module TamB domain-containing protein [Myxococcota bacterium]
MASNDRPDPLEPNEEVTKSMPAVSGTPESGVHRRPTSPYGSAPNLPMPPVDGAPAGGQPKKKSKLRKALKITAWFLFIVLIVIPGLALIFFSTGPGKSVARGIVEGALAKRYDGEVKLGGLDYSIFGGTLELTGLEINQHDGTKVVGVGKLAIDMDFLSLLSPPIDIDKVLVEGVRLNLESYADGTSNLKRMMKEPLKLEPKALTLKELDIHDVQVTVKRPDGSTLTVKDVSVLASAEADPLAQKAHVLVKKLALSLGIERPGFSLQLPFSTGMELTQNGERDLNVKLTPEPTTVVVKRGDQPEMRVPIALGTVGAIIQGGMMDTAITDVAAGPLTIKSIAAKGELPPPGQLGLGPGVHSLVVDGVKVDGKAVNALLQKDLLATDIGMGFSVVGPAEKLVVAGKVDTNGGNFALTGWIDASDVLNPTYELKLIGSDIDTTKLLVAPKQALTTSVVLDVKGKGILPGATDAAIHLAVGKTVVAGKTIDSVVADATIKGQEIRVENAVLTAFGQSMRLDLKLDRGTREFDARMRAQSSVGQTLENARKAGVLILPLPPIEGNLDLDFEAFGKLKPQAPVTPETAIVAQTPAEKVPFEEITIKGFIHGDGVKISAFPVSDTGPGSSPETRGVDRSVGKLNVDVDVAVRDLQPQGTVKMEVADLDTGKMKLESAKVDAVLEGLTQKIHLTAHDTKQELDVDAQATSTIDLEKRRATVVIESFSAKKGSLETKLDAPTTAIIDQSKDPGGGLSHVKLEPMRLQLAGGILGLAADADLSPDPNKPGASKVDAMQVAVDLDGLQIGKLAALAKKNTKGLGGTLTGSLRIGGTPAAPAVDFGINLHGHIKSGAPFTLKSDGQIRDSKLELRVAMTDRQRVPLMKLDVAAPLYLPKPGEVGKKPGLAPGGRLKVDFVMPETTLGRLGKLSPNPLPDTVDPDGTIKASMHMTGSPARPTGRWELEVNGGFLRRKGYDKAPAQQRVSIKGSLTPEQGAIALANELAVFLDAGAATPTVDHQLSGSFKRSPLLKGALDSPWSLHGALAPIDLAPLYAMGLGKQEMAGVITSAMDLSGQGQTVLGTIGFAAHGVKVGANPVADIDSTITIGEDDTRVAQSVKVAGLDAVKTDIVIGLAGRGLRATIKDKPRLMASPVSGSIELPEHTLAEWRNVMPKVPNLPGKVGGKLTLGGNPTARGPRRARLGRLRHRRRHAQAPWPSRSAHQRLVTAGGALVVGPNRQVVAGGSVERAPHGQGRRAGREGAAAGRLPRQGRRGRPRHRTALAKSRRRQGAEARRQARLAHGRPLRPVARPGQEGPPARVDAERRHGHLGARHRRARHRPPHPGRPLPPHREPGRPGHRQHPRARSRPAEGQPRHRHHRRPCARRLEAGHRGPEHHLDRLAHRRQGLRRPRGRARQRHRHRRERHRRRGARRRRDHQEPRPERPRPLRARPLPAAGGLRRHHLYGRVRAPAGKLPAPEDCAAPAPRAPPQPASDDPRAALPDAPPPPAPLAVDAHIHIPNPIRVSASIPIDIQLQGAMDVAVRGKDVQLHGKIDVVKGVLGAMGRFFELEDGSIVADGGMDTLKAEIHFAYQPPAIVLREFALPPGAETKARITVFFTQATGQKTYFSGLPGTYLLDMATILNTGRTRLWGAPDAPASETVRFGQSEQALVTTFVQTNLRNLIFMDRYSGWSESMEDPAEYGRLSHYDMQRFVADGGARWRFTAAPPEPGQNRMELGYDWMLANGPRTVLGFGPHFGLDLELGVGLTLDWSSQE